MMFTNYEQYKAFFYFIAYAAVCSAGFGANNGSGCQI
jgi:hypothetical protein